MEAMHGRGNQQRILHVQSGNEHTMPVFAFACQSALLEPATP